MRVGISVLLASVWFSTGLLQAEEEDYHLGARSDRTDAIHVLQGTSAYQWRFNPPAKAKNAKFAPERVELVAKWLGQIRKEFPEVAKIYARQGHEPGSATVHFTEKGAELLKRADWKREGGKIVELKGISGIPAFDKLIVDLDAKFMPFFEFWVLSFSRECDAVEICRRLMELPEIEFAGTNLYAGDGDHIHMKPRGDQLLFVFQRGWGDCPGGCINHHYHYFEVDLKKDKVRKVSELGAKNHKPGMTYLWGVPETWSLAPYKDMAALKKGASHQDWWVAMQAVNITGTLLWGKAKPFLHGSDETHLNRMIAEMEARPEVAWKILLEGLKHQDRDVRSSVLWYFRRISEQKHGVDEAGIKAWKAWLKESQGIE